MNPEKLKRARGKSAPGSSSRAWSDLTPPISEWILEYVSHMGFSRMTPVQANSIPLFIGNKDVVVEAVTGSGKTLAYLIPVIEKLLRLDEPIRKHHVGAIIVSPTRELASQIYAVLLSLLAFHPPSAAQLRPADEESSHDDKDTPASTLPSSTLKIIPQLLLGGSIPPTQDLAYFLTNSPNLLIATPGRLLELLSSPHVHCPQSSFEVLVLDEADRLLDMGFKENIRDILQRLPKQRRTGLFSASISDAVDQLVRVGLRNPVRIAVKVRGAAGIEDRKTPASLQMAYVTTPATHKLPTLVKQLKELDPTPQKTIVYLSTCAAVDYFSSLMPVILPDKYTVIPLHGKQTPAHRNKNYTIFTTSPNPSVLLTTDLASRGLDISGVDLTVQLDPPSDPKTFLHRAGRAGRAGRRGLGIIFLLPGRETEGYPALLEVRKTPVTPLFQPASNSTSPADYIPSADAEACTALLRKQVLGDRTLHEKGQRAFVSWVRSYSKHEAKSIFRISDLPWRELGHAWGLLVLPKMPELKSSSSLTNDGDGDVNIRGLGVRVDWDKYAYKDKQKEKKRARSNDSSAAAGENGVAPLDASQDESLRLAKRLKKDEQKRKNSAWSIKKGIGLSNYREGSDAQSRKEKRASKREAARLARMSQEDRAREMETKEMLSRVRSMYASSSQADSMQDEEWKGFD